MAEKRYTQFNLSSLSNFSSLSLNVTHPETPQETLRKKKKNSLQNDKIDPETGLLPLEQVEPELEHPGIIRINHRSPWDKYLQVFMIQLDSDDFIPVCTKRQQQGKLVVIKRLPGSDAIEKVRKLWEFQHENIVSFLEDFEFQGCHYVVLEYMNITIAHFKRCAVYPNESQLAAIVGQIIKGLEYLLVKGFEHGNLSSRTVLLNYEGVVKMTCQESSYKVSKNTSRRYIEAIGVITTELIDKSTNGHMGIKNINGGNAANFVLIAKSTDSLKDLSKHRLLANGWEKESLIWIIEIISIESYRGHRNLIQT